MYEHRRTVFVSKEEAELLGDVIDLHVAQMVDAKDMTIDDPTVETADQLLDLVSGYDEDARMLKRVRDQLKQVTASPQRKWWEKR